MLALAEVCGNAFAVHVSLTLTGSRISFLSVTVSSTRSTACPGATRICGTSSTRMQVSLSLQVGQAGFSQSALPWSAQGCVKVSEQCDFVRHTSLSSHSAHWQSAVEVHGCDVVAEQCWRSH